MLSEQGFPSADTARTGKATATDMQLGGCQGPWEAAAWRHCGMGSGFSSRGVGNFWNWVEVVGL